MFRRTLRKLIPIYAILPLIMTGLMNLLAYQGAKLFQVFFGTDSARDMTSALDRAIPFCPVWVWIYLGTFLFWIYQNLTVAQESPKMAYRLAAADFVAKLICLGFFVFLPTTNIRPEVTGGGVTAFVMRFVYWIDTPTNLFPSIHCMVAWLGTRYIYECKHLKHRVLVSVLCTVGSLLVFASTLFTRQHVLLDVLSGVAVAEIGWLIARYTKLPKCVEKLNDKFMKTRLCAIL